MSSTRILPWVVIIGLVAFTAATYAGLPMEIPTKITSRGVVTHTEAKTFIHWFMPVGIALLTQAFLTGLTVMLRGKPHLFNFPEKERFLALPSEYRPPVIERMQFAMDIIGVLTMLIMFYVQFMLWRTALGNPHTVGFGAMIALTVLFTPTAFLLVSRVSAEVDVQEKRWRGNTSVR